MNIKITVPPKPGSDRETTPVDRPRIMTAAVFAATVERFVVRDGVDLAAVADLGRVRVALVMAARRLHRVSALRETARDASTTHTKYLLLATPAVTARHWPAACDANAALDAAEDAFEQDKATALALLAALPAGATWGDVVETLTATTCSTTGGLS